MTELFELETREAYTVIDDDPEDEIFYSTCYKKVPLSGFDLLPPTGPAPPPPPVPPAPWRVGDRCLACADVDTSPVTGYWRLSAECEMCSRVELPPVPRTSVVTASFTVSGAAMDVDMMTQDEIEELVAMEAGVSAAAVDLYIAQGSGSTITVRISVDADAADSTVDVLNAGIFASASNLQAAFDDMGVSGVDVTAITFPPTVTERGSSDDGSGDGGGGGDDGGGMGIAVIAGAAGGGGFLLLLLIVWYCRRRRGGRPPPPPPPPPGALQTTKVEMTWGASEGAASGVPPPPPPALPGGWTEQYDASSGQAYFYNPETGEARWDSPVISQTRV